MSSSRADKTILFLIKERPATERYGLSLLIVFISLLVSSSCQNSFPEAHLYSINLASAILAAAIGGLGPGVLAAILEALAVEYFFLHSERFASPTSLLRITLYTSFGWFTSVLVSHLRHSLKNEKKLRERSERALAARESTLSLVFHDLRTPLTAISLSNSMIARKLPQDSPLQSKTKSVSDCISQMTSIINDLLDAVRIEAGTFKIIPKPTDINELCSKALMLIEASAERKLLRLQKNINVSGDATIDQERFLRVLTNILENAIKFSPSGSLIEIVAESEETAHIIRISDEGPGVRKEDRTKIFDRFWQEGAHGKAGVGLGLFIAKSVVEQSGGTIQVLDSPLGAVFEVRIPR